MLGGDEWARTQIGNNNAYCQDNEIGWLSWEHDEKQKALFDFTKKLIHLRRDHPVFRRPKFFQGRRIRGSEIKDVMWFNPGGNEMSDEEWIRHSFAAWDDVSGDTMDVSNFEGEPIHDDTFLVLLNARHEALPFVLPGGTHRMALAPRHRDRRRISQRTEKGSFRRTQGRGDRSRTLSVEVGSGSEAEARKESWKKRKVAWPKIETQVRKASAPSEKEAVNEG